MSDVVTFGEAMMRFSPPDFMRLEQTAALYVRIGGGELNVAVGVSRLGLGSCWVSRLPQNALGRMVCNKAREHGVNADHIIWTSGGRVGLYFVEFGASPRASSVLYDRAGSAISQIQPGEVDWANVFRGARWFHTSGITPALSDSAAVVTREAMEAAKKAGIGVSYDLNYRSKLWTPEEARRCQEPLMEFVDVLITTEEDTKVVFEISGRGAGDETVARVTAEPYKEVAQKLAEKSHFQALAITLRENPSVWKNSWTAIAYADGQFYEGRKCEIEVVDRLGGGDSFSTGFIYGYLAAASYETAVCYGVAFSALKRTNPGDLNYGTRAEAEALMKGAMLRVTR